ncbi:MAG: hypothetical protein AB7O24_21220 [Kofleriaceae bacterium]
MRVFASLVTILIGCGGSGSNDDDTMVGGSFTSTSFNIPAAGNGSIALLAYGGPLVAVDGDRVLASGLVSFDVSASQREDSRTLTALEGGEVQFVKRYTYPNTFDVRPSSIVSDGAGGAYLAATRLYTGQSYVSEPVITHFDASGAVTWSRSYATSSMAQWNLPQISGLFGYTNVPDVTLSSIIDGKLAVIAGSCAMVIDTAGNVQWAQQFPGQTALAQLRADADGFTIWGFLYDALLVIRYDWTGTVVSYRQAPGSVRGGMTFSTPHQRADGNLVIGWDTFDELNLPISGAIVFDPGGAVIDDFTFQLQASYDPRQTMRAVSQPSRIRFLSDDLATSHHTYKEGLRPPFRDVGLDIVFQTSATGDAVSPAIFSARAEGAWFRLGDGSVYTVASLGVGYGGIGASCATNYVAIDSLTKGPSAGVIQPLVAASVAPTVITVTPAEEPVTVTDAGMVTATETGSQTCSE